MIRWLQPPPLEDEYERVAYYSLHYTLQLLFVLNLITSIPPKTISHLIIAPAIGVVIAISYVLLQQRRLQLAASVFLGSFWVLITMGVYLVNGIHGVALYVYVIIIIFANIVFARSRVVLFFTVISCLSTVIVTLGDLQGVLPLQFVPPAVGDLLVIALGVFGATGILSSVMSHSLRDSLMRLRQNETALQARNLELETLTKHLTVSEQRYRLLFENYGVMAVVYDSDSNIVLANDVSATAIGRPRSAIEGLHVSEVLLPEHIDLVIQMNQQALETGEAVIAEGSSTLASGKQIHFLRHVIPLPDLSDTGKRQLLTLTTDLTEQKRAAERQQELQTAQERIKFFTEFFSMISHDIKTPLAVMNTSLYLLERAEDTERQKQKIGQLSEQVKLLEQYIQDMLMISRLDHVPSLNLESTDFVALIGEILQALHPKSELKGIRYSTQYQDAVLVGSVDKIQMRRALTNLVENAINYTPYGGQIEILMEQHNGAININISDTGIGILAEDIPYIFNPYFRGADAKTTLTSGSGLGLAIVKKVVELHGGTISVTSQPQQGSSFMLTLPV